jgi:Xaa-Pro aminopeptidase
MLNVAVLDYTDIWSTLKSLPGKGKVVLGDKASYALVSSVGSERASLQPNGTLPIALLKARKNAVELEGMRKAYLRDGVAWAKWAAWLEETVQRRGSSINEWNAAVRFQQIRSGMHNYAGFDAYESISASGGNAALPHYETPEEGSKVIDRVTPYLNDSGGQYFDGTIDCTRTVHFGKPTKEQKNAYTKVLQGHIAIDSASE